MRNVCRPVVFLVFLLLPVAVVVRDADAQDSATIRVRIRSDSGHIIKYSLAAILRQRPDSLRLVTRAEADTLGTATLRVIPGDSLLLSVRGIGYRESRSSLPTRLPADTTVDVSLDAESGGLLEGITACDAHSAFRLTVPRARADSTMRIQIVVRDGDFVERRDVDGQPSRDPIHLVWGRPGVYDLEVSSPGYRTWSARRVVVQAGPCGPKTREFQVDLERR